MANKTPHIVGGGLGSIRKRETAKAVAKAKAAQQRGNQAAIAAIVNSGKK